MLGNDGEDVAVEMTPATTTATAGVDSLELEPALELAPEVTVGSSSSPTDSPAPAGADAAARRVQKTYLSMVGFAYLLAVASPGTILWTSSSACAGASSSPGDHDGVSSAASSIVGCAYGTIDARVLAKLTLWALALLASFRDLRGSDPGSISGDILRRWDDAEPEDHAEVKSRCFLEPAPPSSTRTDGLVGELDAERDLPRSLSAKLYPHSRRKRCERCGFRPPLRSHHCKACDACVATFDHHCAFLGTCVGERNHFRFWTFVALNVVCLHVALGIVGTGRWEAPVLGLRADSRLLAAVARAAPWLARLYLYPIYAAALALWVVHTILALTGSTTFEWTKGPERIEYLRGTRSTDFPFGKGAVRNVAAFVARDDVWARAAARVGRSDDGAGAWTPVRWRMPDRIERESEDWWNHPWQNKYWSCC
ncbi:hypothetical protein ACHAWF_011245 [Thalassiosira exigua]